MRKAILRLSYLLFIGIGLGSLAYGVQSALGPDLAYAIQQQQAVIPTVQQLLGVGPAQAPAGLQAAPTPAHVPYPRGQGKPGVRLVIPRMQLDTSIQEAHWSNISQQGNLYTDWVLPWRAAGHLANTAQPGEAGNMVLSGHNNLVGPNEFGVGLFAGLWNLKTGDVVYVLDASGRAFEYRVLKSYALKEEGMPESVRAQHARQVLADNGAPIATLLTCWNGPVAPLSGNTYRWIVRAGLVGQVDARRVPHYPTGNS